MNGPAAGGSTVSAGLRNFLQNLLTHADGAAYEQMQAVEKPMQK
jgi:hypothetical protein